MCLSLSCEQLPCPLRLPSLISVPGLGVGGVPSGLHQVMGGHTPGG